MTLTSSSRAELLAQIRDLQARCQESEETLRAIRNGTVDALVVAGPRGDQVFTLQGADHSFRVLVETMSDGALTMAANGMILYSNPRFAQMIGLPLQKAEGSSLAEYVVEADRPLLYALIREGLTGTSHGALHLLTSRAGTVPVYFASSRMGIDGNSAVALCIVITDLTQQERNHAIVASERLARSILEQAGEVIIVCGPDGIVIRASRQAFRLCDTNPLRQHFAAAFPLWLHRHQDTRATQAHDTGMEHLLSLSAVADGDQVLAVKACLHLKDDRNVPVLASAVALRGDLDELLAFVVTLTDVSELEAAIKELEAFSYSVAHDLRSPLRAIGGFSRILLEAYAPDLPEEAQDNLRRVCDSAKHMGQLIDGLLAFSSLGRQPLKKHAVLPAELVRDVLSELEPEQLGRNVEITIGELTPCQGDSVLLRQVFTNLLSNALKFTRHRELGHIEVGCRQVSGEVVYFVKDDGAGFNMRYADKLFGVFQRLHGADEYEGTGVGLAIVQRIVHRHGGRVWADGAPDRGATVSFTLAGLQSA